MEAALKCMVVRHDEGQYLHYQIVACIELDSVQPSHAEKWVRVARFPTEIVRGEGDVQFLQHRHVGQIDDAAQTAAAENKHFKLQDMQAASEPLKSTLQERTEDGSTHTHTHLCMTA